MAVEAIATGAIVGCTSLCSTDDGGITIRRDDAVQRLPVDTVIVCAGQESTRDLYDALAARREGVHLIGGADLAVEIDAKRAIDQGCRLAAGF